MKKDNPWGEFCRIFGHSPRNRIIEVLLTMSSIDFSIGDVAQDAELNRATTYNVMKELIKEGYVIQTRKSSGAQLYKLNKNKEEVQILLKAFSMVLRNIAEKYTKKEKIYA